jgi:hypothetical protein
VQKRGKEGLKAHLDMAPDALLAPFAPWWSSHGIQRYLCITFDQTVDASLGLLLLVLVLVLVLVVSLGLLIVTDGYGFLVEK